MPIGNNDLVLEVGSGDMPYPRSDILCDRYPGSTPQRLLNSKLIIDRPTVIADGERLPFTTKAFDYVIASHVLEHVEHPRQFLAELQRVGEKGYLAFPSPLQERFYNNKTHKWYCSIAGKKLTLIRKSKKSRKRQSSTSEEKIFNLVMRYFSDQCQLSFEWSNSIQFKILEAEPAKYLQTLDRQLQILMDRAQRMKAPHPVLLKMQDNLFSVKHKTARTLERLYWRTTRKLALS
ncbi:MAG TPA: methyltransferase domain-containing protein [Patescibacteria group bacterium]|nr:methyltransferase domain-containing protein [Patescibacteria group bacterium]